MKASKKKRFVWLMGILVVIVAAIVIFIRSGADKHKTLVVPTQKVQLGNLAATVNTSGNIAAHQTMNLSFYQSGIVSKVNIHIGDIVKTGQVLAELDTEDLELQLQNAQLNLDVSRIKYEQAKKGSSEEDIANARAKLEAAQANYNSVTAGASESELAAAKASVASAQANYDSAVKAASSNRDLESARVSLEKATMSLQTAQVKYAEALNENSTDTSAAEAYRKAQLDYDQAKANYDAIVATADSDAAAKVIQAHSQLEQAQASLTKLQSQASEASITSAQLQLTQAQNDLAKVLAGTDENSLQIAKNSVTQAEIALKQVQTKLEQAKIVAPFDGIVTSVNIIAGQSSSIGQSASTNSGAITVVDISSMEIIANISEVDIHKVKVGQAVTMTIDALANVEITGVVTQIIPAGTINQGVVTYPVTITLSNPPETAMPGMTANVMIIVEQRENVLLVPNRAIHRSGENYSVTVIVNGLKQEVPVTTGLSGTSMTEIVSGLSEGDDVVISIHNNRTSGGVMGASM